MSDANPTSMKSHFSMMARYNAWANSRLYKMAADLPEELYRSDVGAYFRSLHGTLNHLLVADRIWMRRLTRTGGQPDTLDAILFEDVVSLHTARVSEDERIVEFVGRLKEEDMDKRCDYQTMSGTPQSQPIREILAHLFNHQTHHRGQAHGILTQLGVAEPDPLDLIIMQRS